MPNHRVSTFSKELSAPLQCRLRRLALWRRSSTRALGVIGQVLLSDNCPINVRRSFNWK